MRKLIVSILIIAGCSGIISASQYVELGQNRESKREKRLQRKLARGVIGKLQSLTLSVETTRLRLRDFIISQDKAYRDRINDCLEQESLKEGDILFLQNVLMEAECAAVAAYNKQKDGECRRNIYLDLGQVGLLAGLIILGVSLSGSLF